MGQTGQTVLAGGNAAFYQLNLAERLLDAGVLDEATRLLKESVQQTPTLLTPRVRLGYALLLQKDAAGALTQLTQAEKLSPTAREVQRGIPTLLTVDLARAYALHGDVKESLAKLQQLKTAGALEPVDLSGSDFTSLQGNIDFEKLRGK